MLPLEAPVTIATLPSRTLAPILLIKLVEAVRALPGRDMLIDHFMSTSDCFVLDEVVLEIQSQMFPRSCCTSDAGGGWDGGASNADVSDPHRTFTTPHKTSDKKGDRRTKNLKCNVISNCTNKKALCEDQTGANSVPRNQHLQHTLDSHFSGSLHPSVIGR